MIVVVVVVTGEFPQILRNVFATKNIKTIEIDSTMLKTASKN